MKQLKTEITIKATKERVWSILMDFERYHEWNPFIQSIIGRAAAGETLTNTLKLEGQKTQQFKPKVLTVKENKEFRWLGHLFIPGLFDGEHYFIIEESGDNQVRFVQGEKFGGIFSGLIMNMIGEKTRQGFMAMNEALRKRAESNFSE